MGKHTPGPWVAFYKSKYGEWHVGVPSSVGTMKVGLFPNGIQTEHPEGDANLIAAAPDLLSALKDLLFNCDHGNGLNAWEKTKEKARAAISKAEGV